ncbi:MAG TPA: VOC family protein [Usitatibacter sp.]|nr:VOC family protein [Usitatibacter sp.]
MILLDHLVVAAVTLDEGAAWLESRLGVPVSPGGRHDAMGTHNRLLSLGPGRYLELIAIDPGAPAPQRARWFELDAPAMRARLARSPALIHWVARTDDIEHAVGATAFGHCDILSLARGPFRWRIGVPPSGSLAQDGIAPTMIEWQGGGHPSELLPDAGCRLEALVLCHPEAPETLHSLSLAGLAPGEPVEAATIGRGLDARIRTPRGIVELRE